MIEEELKDMCLCFLLLTKDGISIHTLYIFMITIAVMKKYDEAGLHSNINTTLCVIRLAYDNSLLIHMTNTHDIPS